MPTKQAFISYCSNRKKMLKSKLEFIGKLCHRALVSDVITKPTLSSSKLDRQYFCLSNEIPFRPSALFQQWLSGVQAASPPRQRTARSWSGCISSIKVMTGHGSCGLLWGGRGSGGVTVAVVLICLKSVLTQKQQKFPSGPCTPAPPPPHPALPRFGPAAKSEPLCPT